ncbi:hypothetical protein NQ317_012385 [Molorchus minor]|uniref:Mnd1 HTH domain-containing protein n=1 Tax=Molorchus minor TaxID=1323400 RepID=A0ABQ9IQ49_9CUCU|nr:hypothetical protein NQ317_012385 [Molorchus minor]
MSKKGVSAEEKKSRMLQFDLLGTGKKLHQKKRYRSQFVKDVIQKLVEEGLVDTDKIGGSIYFWAFPSKAFNTRKRKLAELQNDLDDSTKKLKLVERKP